MKTIKYTLTALTLTIAIGASAQKLPSIQTAGVLAPAGIKIDGKATEWDDKFQAYNNHVEFFYTLSNDGTNLYLTVQAVEKEIVRRIMNGGISLVINKTSKKNDKDGMAITYPVFETNNLFRPRFNGPIVMKSFSGNAAPMGDGAVSFNSGGGGGGGSQMVTRIVSGGPAGPSASSKPFTSDQLDSLMRVNNTDFNNKAKNIGLKGFKDLDSLMSVYNEDGIKAAGTFDTKGVYTYEMAMPLKYFGLDANSASKFTYHILINAVEQKGVNIVNSTGPDGSQKIMSVSIGAGAQMGQDATDFWGEYTLAKK